jgi:hypothetical protein
MANVSRTKSVDVQDRRKVRQTLFGLATRVPERNNVAVTITRHLTRNEQLPTGDIRVPISGRPSEPGSFLSLIHIRTLADAKYSRHNCRAALAPLKPIGHYALAAPRAGPYARQHERRVSGVFDGRGR